MTTENWIDLVTTAVTVAGSIASVWVGARLERTEKHDDRQAKKVEESNDGAD